MDDRIELQVEPQIDVQLAMRLLSKVEHDGAFIADVLTSLAWLDQTPGATLPKCEDDVRERIAFFQTLTEEDRSRVHEFAQYLVLVILQHLTKYVKEPDIEPSRIVVPNALGRA